MRYSRLLPVLVLCLLMLASCVKRPADYSTVKPYGPAEWFMSDPAPEPLEVRGNPLDFSGAKLGIDPRNFELPRAHEGASRLAARFPPIDQISNNPLYMKQWAEDMGLELQDAVFEGMGDALSLALVQLRGTSAYWPEVCAEYDEHVMHFAQQLEGRPFTPEFREVLESLFSSFAQGYLL